MRAHDLADPGFIRRRPGILMCLALLALAACGSGGATAEASPARGQTSARPSVGTPTGELLENDAVAVPRPEGMLGEVVDATTLEISSPDGEIRVTMSSGLSDPPVALAEAMASSQRIAAEEGMVECGSEPFTLLNWPPGGRVLAFCTLEQEVTVFLATSHGDTHWYKVVVVYPPERRDAVYQAVHLGMVEEVRWKLYGAGS